jgi:hypothetical protein
MIQVSILRNKYLYCKLAIMFVYRSLFDTDNNIRNMSTYYGTGVTIANQYEQLHIVI